MYDSTGLSDVNPKGIQKLEDEQGNQNFKSEVIHKTQISAKNVKKINDYDFSIDLKDEP